jgi:hypothetical protein
MGGVGSGRCPITVGTFAQKSRKIGNQEKKRVIDPKERTIASV